MTNYGDADGVIAIYPRIQSVTTITSTIIESYIDRVEAKIDAAIAHRYTVPVPGRPPLLGDIAETLTAARFIRRFFPDQGEIAQAWYDEANEILNALATGSFTLIASGGTIVAEDQTITAPWSNTKGFVPTFPAVLDLEESYVDKDRVEKERTDRGIL